VRGLSAIIPAKQRMQLGRVLLEEELARNNDVRWRIAREYLAGDGIEIGALHLPMQVPERARVKYVDRMRIADLRKQYPELNDLPLVEADIIDNGETLATIASASQDFVIAAHMLEHTEDPIDTLKNWERVLKPGGILYLALPNKKYTFDIDRELTTFEHLENDHINGAEVSRRQHFEEWVRHVNKKSGPEHLTEVERLMEMDYSIHFHVWDEVSFLGFISAATEKYMPGITPVMFQQNGHEMLMILRRKLI